MTINRIDQIQFLRGTEAAIVAENPIPFAGEPVVATDTKKLWLGDGTTPVNSMTAISGSAGSMATDALWGAAGDLAYATANDAATRLPIGTALQVLRVNAGATAPEWATAASGSVATDAIWDAADDLAIGTGPNTAARVAFGANTFPAKASTGALVAKTISDAALSVLDDATLDAMLATLGGAAATGSGGLVRLNAPTITGTLTAAALQTTGNVVIDGDLTVSGTTFTVDTATYLVEDPLIKLGKANAGDLVDLGWYAPYVSAGTKYTGLFRDATDGKFRLFGGLQSEPTTTVDTGGAGYAAATLVASLEGNAATVTTNANLTGPITSVGNATAVAAQTGTGTTFVMQASPTLTTPVIGVALATSVRTTEVTSTPAGTTQTITLANGNHQTLALTSATGTVTATITVPSSSSAGTIIVKQHASAAKDITWAVSAGSIVWLGTEPDWGTDAISKIRIVAWRFDGTNTYLSSTDTN